MKGLEITDEEKWIEEFNRQFNISRENNKTFAEMIRPIIERTNTYNFCAKTELTEMTFSRFRCLVKPNSKSKYLPKLNTFVAFCIGYEIDLPNAITLRRAYGRAFNVTDPVHYAYMYLISHYGGKPISECNDLLRKIGIEEKFLLRENSKK